MGVFTLWSGASTKSSEPASVGDKQEVVEIIQTSSAEYSSVPGATENASLGPSTNPEDVALPSSPPALNLEASQQPAEITTSLKRPVNPNRRFSFRSFTLFNGREDHAPRLSKHEEHEKKERAAEAYTKRTVKQSSSDKRAKESALIVRSIIVGPASITPSAPKRAVTKPQMKRVKAQLLEPKSANKVIAHLRELPVTEEDTKPAPKHGPIHAVCLTYTESEAQERHFSRLTKDDGEHPSVLISSIETLSSTFEDLHLIDLLMVPDLGLTEAIGSPGEGILSGAVPTAETVISGITRITPELMNLGYATSKAILPDHTGVYPPTDRISVLTYWWGLEVCFPSESMHYLSNVDSISHSVVNFLTAMAMVNNGVTEILPFVRYISSYVDFEWSYIQKQDRGQGVVCAATWIMPAAMVPRPWDFLPAPAKTAPVDGTTAPESGAEPGVTMPSDETTKPEPETKLEPPVTTPNGTTEPEPGSEPTEALAPLPSLKITPPTLSRKTGETEAPENVVIEPAIGLSAT